MHKLIALGKLDPTIQKIATWIRIQVPDDYRGASKRLADHVFRFVRRHQIFQRDPFQVERIEHPIESMRPIIQARRAGTYKGRALVVGDCDTLSAVWLGSLLGAMGFQYALETTKVDNRRPDEFSHVLLSVLVGDEWYPLDPSTPGVPPGWRPPVPTDRMRRWNEKKIEEVVGMSGMNGHPRGNGLGYQVNHQRIGQDDWPEVRMDSEWVEQSEYGYGIPKSLGNPDSRKRVPPTTGGKFQQLIPEQPAEPRQDMERPLSDYTKRRKPSQLTRPGRISSRAYQRPFYRKTQPYIHTAHTYPPGSPWGGPIAYEQYDRPKPYIHTQAPRAPVERRVDVVTQEPIPMRRGKIRDWKRHKSKLVFMRPETPSASLEGYGMNQVPSVDETYLTPGEARSARQMPNGRTPYLTSRAAEAVEERPVGTEAYLTSREVVSTERRRVGMSEAETPSTYARAQELIKGGMTPDKAWTQAFIEGGKGAEEETKKEAETASKSVWGGISDMLTNLIPTVGNVIVKREEGKLAERIARATGRVTGGNVTPTPTQIIDTRPVDYSPPTPLWKSPFVWVGGALVLGGAAFLLLRRRSPARSRSNASGSMKYRRRAA